MWCQMIMIVQDILEATIISFGKIDNTISSFMIRHGRKQVTNLNELQSSAVHWPRGLGMASASFGSVEFELRAVEVMVLHQKGWRELRGTEIWLEKLQNHAIFYGLHDECFFPPLISWLSQYQT